MKKGLKITLITISSVIVALGSVFLGFYLNGTCFNSYSAPSEEYESWMKYIDDDTPLNNVVIPGSHDAGTDGMIWFGETQCYSVKEQLESGYRYFDIRVNKRGDNDYAIFHSVIDGTNFVPVLDDLKSFIIDNPSETLLLDFQHFKNDADVDVKDMLKTKFYDDGLLVDNQTDKSDLQFVSELKMSDVRGKCVVLYASGSSCCSESYLFERNNDECSNLWASLNSCYVAEYHKKSSSDFIAQGLPYYFEQIKGKVEEEGYKGLFVLQGQLTDGTFVLGPYSKEKEHCNNMNEYTTALKDSSDLSLVNIIMRDFADSSKAKLIIHLNGEKGVVKESLTGDFGSLF